MIAILIDYGVLAVTLALGKTQIFLLIFKSFSVDYAAAEAAGPAVLVIRPGVHAVLGALVSAHADILEPLVTHVLGLQSAAGVHEKSAYALSAHLVNLFCCLRLVKFFIPRPKRYGAVFFGYIFEVHINKFLSLIAKYQYNSKI